MDYHAMNLFKQYPSHMKCQKNFEKFKEMENGKGTKNVKNPHILRTLANYLIFLDFYFFGQHLNTP